MEIKIKNIMFEVIDRKTGEKGMVSFDDILDEVEKLLIEIIKKRKEVK